MSESGTSKEGREVYAMKPSQIVFDVTESPDGSFEAKAIGYSTLPPVIPNAAQRSEESKISIRPQSTDSTFLAALGMTGTNRCAHRGMACLRHPKYRCQYNTEIYRLKNRAQQDEKIALVPSPLMGEGFQPGERVGRANCPFPLWGKVRMGAKCLPIDG